MREEGNLFLSRNEDSWHFLDDIEAPMWVDLALESQSIYKEVDDNWFNTTHMIHQLSSHELKHVFSHNSMGIPSSVSRSRGKDFERRKLGTSNDLASTRSKLFQTDHASKDSKEPIISKVMASEKNSRSQFIYRDASSSSKNTATSGVTHVSRVKLNYGSASSSKSSIGSSSSVGPRSRVLRTKSSLGSSSTSVNKNTTCNHNSSMTGFSQIKPSGVSNISSIARSSQQEVKKSTALREIHHRTNQNPNFSDHLKMEKLKPKGKENVTEQINKKKLNKEDNSSPCMMQNRKMIMQSDVRNVGASKCTRGRMLLDKCGPKEGGKPGNAPRIWLY